MGSSEEDHVFLTETGSALTIYGMEMLFKRLRKRSGLTGKRISPHIFRKKACSGQGRTAAF